MNARWIFIIVIATAIAIGLTAAKGIVQVRPPSQAKLLIAFGDSVTRGVGASPGHDFPSLLAAAFPGLQVINAGVSGDTTETALARLERDVLSRHPNIVIVGLGGNDFLRGRSREEVISNLGKIVDRIQAQGAIAILVTIGTRDPARILTGEQRTRILGEDDLLSPEEKTRWINWFVEYNRMLVGMAREKGAAVADLYGAQNNDWSLIGPDGLHPNDRAHRLIADELARVLRLLLAGQPVPLPIIVPVPTP